MEVQFENQRGRVKVTCPHCSKAYQIFLSDLHEEANRFVCKQCKEDFWVRRSEVEEPVVSQEPAVSGISSETLLGNKRTEKCPKCSHVVESLEKECGNCGVVGAKFLALQSDSPYLRVNDSLKRLWKRVLNHYDDERVHHEFLSQCLKENQLRYASLQYKQLKETLGADEIVSQMMRKIQSLSTLPLEKKEPAVQRTYPQYVRLFSWEVLLFGIGLLFIISGLASPVAKNLVSVGVVFMALPILIRIFLKRN